MIPATAFPLRRAPNALAAEREPVTPDAARPLEETPPLAPRSVVKPLRGLDVAPSERAPSPDDRSDENPEGRLTGEGGAAVAADDEGPNDDEPRRMPENPCGVLAVDGAESPRVPRYRKTVVPPLLVKPRRTGAPALEPLEPAKLDDPRGALKFRVPFPEKDPVLRVGVDREPPKLPLERGAENDRGAEKDRGADENDDDRGAEKLRPALAPPPKLRDAPPPPEKPPLRPPPKDVVLDLPPPPDF